MIRRRKETPYPSVEALPETDPITNEWNRFYAVPRGHHPDAKHIDLYDQVDKIPFDKLENFFKDSLK